MGIGEYPEKWEEFINSFSSIVIDSGDAFVQMVPMSRVYQMMSHYHNPVVRDRDVLTQAVEELHDITAENEIVRLENENDRLRALVRDMSHYIEWPFVVIDGKMYMSQSYEDLRKRMYEIGVVG